MADSKIGAGGGIPAAFKRPTEVGPTKGAGSQPQPDATAAQTQPSESGWLAKATATVRQAASEVARVVNEPLPLQVITEFNDRLSQVMRNQSLSPTEKQAAANVIAQERAELGKRFTETREKLRHTWSINDPTARRAAQDDIIQGAFPKPGPMRDELTLQARNPKMNLVANFRA